MNSISRSLGLIIRNRRTKLGLSQAKVAELTGKTQSQIARLERGLGDPRISSVVQVSRSLGTEPAAIPIRLLSRVGRPFSLPNMNQALSHLDLESSLGMIRKTRKRMAMSNKRSLAQLSVWLGQTLVGSITELPNDRSLLPFDETYAENPDRPVLSLSYYDAEGRLDTTPVPMQMKVAPFFSNLLPEAKLREYVAQRAGVKSVRDLPLLQLLGEDLPGAVVVRAVSDGPPPEAFGEDETPAKLVDESQPLRFSLAGVQMKFSASGSPKRGLTIPTEGRGGHWIIKLPSEEFPLVPENEHSMMQVACNVGIDTAETGLVPIGEIEGLPPAFQRGKSNALWVRRFDRTQTTRVHTEDFNQVYGQFPDDKYKNFSYANMAGDLARIVGFEAVQEFVRRIVFSAAIGNADMHLKNWTLAGIQMPGLRSYRQPMIWCRPSRISKTSPWRCLWLQKRKTCGTSMNSFCAGLRRRRWSLIGLSRTWLWKLPSESCRSGQRSKGIW